MDIKQFLLADTSVVQRNRKSEIDVKYTLQSFAEELLRLKAEEKRIRDSKRYKKAVLQYMKLESFSDK